MRGAPSADRPRGQTTQDYAIGIGLFLLVVVFVLTFVPSVLAPFGGVDEPVRTAQAERLATALVEDASVDGERLHLDGETLESLLDDDPTDFGLPGHVRYNVTVQPFDEDTFAYTGGSEYDGQDIGTWTRVVTTTDDACAEGCRLVVRVW